MAAADATIDAAGTLVGRNIVRFTGTFGAKAQAVGIGLVGSTPGGKKDGFIPAAWMEQTGTGATVACHEGSRLVAGATLNQNVEVIFNWLAPGPATTAFGTLVTKDLANVGGGFILITDAALVDPDAGGASIPFEVYVIYPHSLIR